MNIDTPGDTIMLGTKGGLRIPSTNCWNGSVGGPMTIYHSVAGEQVETKIPIIETHDSYNIFDKKFAPSLKPWQKRRQSTRSVEPDFLQTAI